MTPLARSFRRSTARRERLIEEGRHILFIGHAGHPEVIGTFGQVPEGLITLVETVENVAELMLAGRPPTLPFSRRPRCPWTTLRQIVDALKARFPAIRAPRSEDICYATSNRQAAVKAIAGRCDAHAGDRRAQTAPIRSASVEVAERARSPVAPDRACRGHRLAGSESRRPLGITAGASAPEILVREVVDCTRTRFDVTEEVADHSVRANDLQAASRAESLTEARPEVEMFTDGACKGNPGPGGWGVLLRMGEQETRAVRRRAHDHE